MVPLNRIKLRGFPNILSSASTNTSQEHFEPKLRIITFMDDQYIAGLLYQTANLLLKELLSTLYFLHFSVIKPYACT